jgi:shikimate kinase
VTREAENIAHSGQDHRPLPADTPGGLRRVVAEREHLYAQLADITVDVGAAGPAATCDQVLAALRRVRELAGRC